MDLPVKQAVRGLIMMPAAPWLKIPTAHLGILRQGLRQPSGTQAKVKRRHHHLHSQDCRGKEAGLMKQRMTGPTATDQGRGDDDDNLNLSSLREVALLVPTKHTT